MKQQVVLDERFKLINQIGEGGFGGIYLCQDLLSRKYCALKLNRSEETKEIDSEISIMKQLNHPNVLSIYECGQGQGVLT